jgi:hypothetical protein
MKLPRPFGHVAPLSFQTPFRVGMEQIVRPFETPKSILPSPTRPAVQIEEEESEFVTVQWGRSGTQFDDEPAADPVEDMNADGYAATGTGEPYDGMVYVDALAGNEKQARKRPPQDKVPGVRAYDEIDRQVRTDKIYSPDDPDVWLLFDHVISMRFRGPNGVVAKFNFKPKPPPARPKRSA